MTIPLDQFIPDEPKKRSDSKTIPLSDFVPVEQTGILRGAGDLALSVGKGLSTGVQMTADAFGANNAVSRGAKRLAEGLGDLKSDASKFEEVAAAQRREAAEASGSGWNEFKAGVTNFGARPGEMLLEGIGSSIPTLATVAATRGKINPLAAGSAVGAVQGAGSVKGQIYEDVKQQHTSAGMTEADAEARAQAAQAYSGENKDQIALGGALGALAGSTGAERAISRLTGGVQRQGVKSVLATGAAEGATEFTQGGQEKLAANVALQREGFDTPTWRGVIGQGTEEGLAGAGAGAAFGTVEALTARPQAVVDPNAGAISKAVSNQPGATPQPDGTVAVDGGVAADAAQAEAQARAATDEGLAATPPGYAVSEVAPTAAQFVAMPSAEEQALLAALPAEEAAEARRMLAQVRDAGQSDAARTLVADRLATLSAYAQALSDPAPVGAPALDAVGVSGRRALLDAVAGDERESVLSLLAVARSPSALPQIRQRAQAQLQSLAIERMERDGKRKYTRWQMGQKPMPLEKAQALAAAGARQGAEFMVAPHGKKGFTVVPPTWLSGAQREQFAALQSGGALPGPDATTGVLRVGADGAVSAETRAQAEATRRTVADIARKHAEMGKMTPKGARPAAPVSEQAADTPRAPWQDALDTAWNDGFETGNNAFVAAKQDLEERYGPLSDAQVDEYSATYRAGAAESALAEAPAAPAPNTPDRRVDADTRKRVSDMSPEEMRAALLTDTLTGIGNRRAYVESTKLPAQASIDADSLKWVNDNLGHDSGDKLLRAIGDAIAAETPNGYHISGDEFIVQAESVVAARMTLVAVNARLSKAIIHATNTSDQPVTLRGVGISYGIAENLTDAEKRLAAHKAERERNGLRSARGETPPNAVVGSQGEADRPGGVAPAPEAEAKKPGAIVPAATPALRAAVEALIKRRSAASQVGLGSRLSRAIDKAKKELEGTGDGKAGYYRRLSAEFAKKRDQGTADVLTTIHDLLRDANKQAKKNAKAEASPPAVAAQADAATAEKGVTPPAAATGDDAPQKQETADKWRKNAILARNVAKKEGVDPTGKTLVDLVAAIDAKRAAGGREQPSPEQTARQVQAELYTHIVGLADAHIDAYRVAQEFVRKEAEKAREAEDAERARALEEAAKNTALLEAAAAEAKAQKDAADAAKRGRKLENTGVELRRWFDKETAGIKAADSDAAVLAALDKATTRAEFFRGVLAEDATPGAHRMLEILRNDTKPFREWVLNSRSPLKFDGLHSYGKRRWQHSESKVLADYLEGGLGASGLSRDERIAQLKSAAEEYANYVMSFVDRLRGERTVRGIAETLSGFLSNPQKRKSHGYPAEDQLNEAGVAMARVSRKYKLATLRWIEDRDLEEQSWTLRSFVAHESITTESTRKAPLTPPRLDSVTREGGETGRKGKDATPQQTKTHFGFADVGFGKWVAAKRDQKHLNYTFDAFADMADILGLPPKAMALGGKLYFTIGALGHGKFAAHYSPGQPHPDGGTVPVINVTNTKGDGTVAHEWGHAFDLTPGATSDAVQGAIREIKRALMRSYDLDFLRRRAIPHLEGSAYFKGSKSDQRSEDGRIRSAERAIDYYNSSTRMRTRYFTNAEALDGSKAGRTDAYWSNDKEIFARAWEAWISDTLEEKQRINTYLVNPAWVGELVLTEKTHRGTPYPEGDERQRFADWFAALAKSLRFKDGVIALDAETWAKEKPDEVAQWADAVKQLKAELVDMASAVADKKARDAEAAAQERAASEARAAEALTEARKRIGMVAHIKPGWRATLESAGRLPKGSGALEVVDADLQYTNRTDILYTLEAEGKSTKFTVADYDIERFEDPAPAAESPPANGGMSDAQLSALFDEAAAELAESTQEQPDAPPPGEPVLSLNDESPAKGARTRGDAAKTAAADVPDDKARETAGELAKEAAKLGVKGIDEALTGLVKLFGGGPGKLQSFPSGFDEDTYKAALPHFKAALAAFQQAGKSLKDLFGFLIQNTGLGVKPYAIQFAKDEGLAATLAAKPSASRQVAEFVSGKLAAGERITALQLFDAANTAYGGRQSEGAYSPKDAYDAMEAGVNLHLIRMGTLADGDAAQAAARARALRELIDLLPTQTKRDADTDEFQQFSTPPALAQVASWVANVGASDRLLEPSAGTGDLAVYAKNAGAELVLNELHPRRAAILRDLFPDATVRTENAEQLNNILPSDTRPTVVVMNPPFSSTAGRVQGKRDTMNGAQHVEQALKYLLPGGRLVAIVGQGMAHDRPAFKAWWAKIEKEYNVRANVGIDGKEYAKYGTTFDNQIFVIDKTGPTTGTVLTGNVASVADLPAMLEGIRNDRLQVDRPPEQDAPAVPGSSDVAGQDAVADGLGGKPAPGQPDPVGGDGGRAPGQAGGGRGRNAGADGKSVDAGADAGKADAGRGRGGKRPDAEGRGIPGKRSGDAVGDVDGVKLEAPTGKDKPADAPLTDAIFEEYAPQKLRIKGAKPHPGELVQSAAMASVEPPTPTYTPKLPADLVESGRMSLAQLESVVYAGQAHEQFLPNGERRGFFIGDGTGVGKGREISGILLDNLNQGRKKALWVSFNSGLMADAQRDMAGIGADKNLLFSLDKGPGKTPLKGGSIKMPEGVLFTTYSTLSNDSKGEGGKVSESRLQQIVAWLGEDFDGVIAFDEAHKMGNAIEIKGKRGKKKPSKAALAGVALQKRLPKARVVYVSATGATEVSNLAYASRLGLWGEGTAFASPAEFIGNVDSAGVAGMELVARDMKALGMYIARSLSYRGVGYQRLEHELTPLQTDIYNELADAWQLVLTRVNDALESTGQGKNGDAKGAAMSAFWGSHQRFFNQIITTMQTPTVIEDAKQRLARGDSIVIQLVNTNEAEQKRQGAKAAADDTPLEELDFTPRQSLLDYVKNAYPVAQYEETSDENGNTVYVSVKDADGNPVENREAVAAREALLETLQAIKVPENPIDAILTAFGADNVAEVTGRSARFLQTVGEDGNLRVVEQKRSANASRSEASEFQQGKRRVLIFSQAGGTGYSFHADNTAENTSVRAHYLLQPGWRADAAMQGFGRTHRTNQKQPPVYILPTTDLKAQKRFVSSIARRLDQLGALTKGQRDTASQGLFSASDNLESKYAADAVKVLFDDLYANRVEGLTFGDVTGKMGFDNLLDKKTGGLNVSNIPDVPKFLNRLLSLRVSDQAEVFAAFEQRLTEATDYAKQRGTFDDGMQTLKAASAVVARDEVVHTDGRTGAETRYVEVEVTNAVRYQDFNVVKEWAARQGPKFAGFYRLLYGKNKGSVVAFADLGERVNSEGKAIRRGASMGIREGSPTYTDAARSVLDGHGFANGARVQVSEKLTEADARAAWAEALDAAPKDETHTEKLLVGAILPIWDRVKGDASVVRLQTDNGERLIGRRLSGKSAAETLKNLGVGSSASKLTPDQVAERVRKGAVARLANGWRLKQARVSNEPRIELLSALPLTRGEQDLLKQMGLFSERINWADRFFVPTTGINKESNVLSRLLAAHPVVDVGDANADTGAGKEGDSARFSRAALADAPRAGRAVVEHDAVKAIVERVAAGLNLGVDVAVHRSEAALFDAIPAIGKQAKQENAEGEVNAVYFKGQVHVVSSKFASGEDVEASILDALAHEGQGHYGIRAMHGGDTRALRQTLNALYREVGGEAGVKRLADKHGVDMGLYFDTAARMNPAERPAYLMDELLAHLQGRAATASLPRKVLAAIKAYMGAVRDWLRAHGLVDIAKGSDADIALLLRRMREASTRAYSGKGLRARFVRSSEAAPQREFVRAPNGSFDFGEITADQARVMRRQAGKIRLEHGDAAYGKAHIEARHGKQIRALGFPDVETFVADALGRISAIWKPSKSAQLVVIQSAERGKAVVVELKPAQSGDYYTVTTAFPVAESYAERKKGWSLLWGGVSVPAVAPGADSLADTPPIAGAASAMTPSQSSEANIAQGLIFEADVPNEHWLNEQIDYAKSRPRNKYGVPYMGKVTGSFKGKPTVSVATLAKLKGERGEQQNIRQDDLDWLTNEMRRSGLDNIGAPYIEVGHDGVPWVSEGNHRIMAAQQLGWDSMPVEIRYFDGGERKARGAFAPSVLAGESGNDGIMFSRAARIQAETELGKRFADLMQTKKTFNVWWHKTVGTQYHKATVDKDFARVYDATQAYLSGVSAFANSAADAAPSILPRLDSLRDIGKKRPKAADMSAVSGAVFTGTLEDKRVYDASELRERFKLTEVQIGLYQQVRAAIDRSLDDLTRADVLRISGKNGEAATGAVLDAADLREAATALSRHLRALGDTGAADRVWARVTETEKLKAEGYAPLARFGKYTVYVAKGGEQVYFGTFEREYEANRMARQMREDYAGATVTQGVLSGESYKLFAGLSLDTLELFADSVGIGQRALVQDYLKLAKSNRSAMKRLIRRKGVAGFDEDLPRILANFITSNARMASANAYGRRMSAAAEAIPKEKGDVKDEAVKLVEYVQNPTEEAARLRGLLFVQYIGGSVASALVNMTQPVVMTLPYLSQFDGGAWKKLAMGMRHAMGDARKLDAATQVALRRAERDGVVSPQEIHQLQAEATKQGIGVGTLARLAGLQGDKADKLDDLSRKGLFAWGSLFSLAEQFNRRATFIAAFQIARERGMDDPFAFAERAVVETQGVYNKGNRPNWARGAVGATVFTFKQYSISYMEFFKRLPRREQALALAVLVLAAGLNGLPFTEDLDDLLDTLAQRAGYDWNSAAKRREWAVRVLGEGGAEFALYGTSALPGAPLDFAARLGMSNLLPGTGVLRKDTKNKEGEILEVLGPAGGVVRDALQGEFLPLAVRNVKKAYDMQTFGMYRDATGKRVVDTDAVDALVKAVGFQPAKVAQENRALWTQTQRRNLATQVEADIASTWASGIFERDPEAVRRAREELEAWNRNNPQSLIAISPWQIMQRVQAMQIDKRARLLKTTPRELRASVAEGVGV